MDILDTANQLVKSIYDARANGNAKLLCTLEAELAEINAKIILQGFSPVIV